MSTADSGGLNAREHFDWAMTRATEYLDLGQADLAMASLASDLNKHDGTRSILTTDLQMLMTGEYLIGGVTGVRRFIRGLPGPATDRPETAS
jgi:hypothetical protein